MYVTRASSTWEEDGLESLQLSGESYLEFHVVEDEDRVTAGVVSENLLEVGTAG